MSKQFTETQVARVVEEVSRQAQLLELDERERLGREQVVQILEELSLPVELLDPAMRELERREAEAAALAREEKARARQRRRKLLLVGSAVAALLLIILLVAGSSVRSRRARANISVVEQGRVTRANDEGGSLGTVSRDDAELVYRVTLDRVPVGENLSMKCNWINPEGRVVKQNVWQTRTTDKSVWGTTCRHSLGTAAQPGAWSVEMLLEDRVVSRTDFRVE